MSIQKIKEVYNKTTDEKILVVPREKLFLKSIFNGFERSNLDSFEKIIRDFGTFIWRSEAEVNQKFKQIIPYLVFNYENKYFLMQRAATSSEARLKNKYSLGIGGHVRKEDIENNNMLNWCKREFNEEVEYASNLDVVPLGVLNDDSNPVGEVHFGLVFLLKGNSDQIKVRSELKNGKLLTLDEAKSHYTDMETWSQYVFQAFHELEI